MKGFPAILVVVAFLLAIDCLFLVPRVPAAKERNSLRECKAAVPRHPAATALDRLGLTDSQKRDVAGILRKHRDEARALLEQTADGRKQLFAAVRSGEYNETAVRQASRDVSDCEEHLALLRARIFQEINGLLTREQQEKLKGMRTYSAEEMRRRADERLLGLDRWIEANSQ